MFSIVQLIKVEFIGILIAFFGGFHFQVTLFPDLFLKYSSVFEIKSIIFSFFSFGDAPILENLSAINSRRFMSFSISRIESLFIFFSFNTSIHPINEVKGVLIW